MSHLYKFAAILLLVTAVIQWFGIGERIYHALWQWYKFKGFSSDGHTTVSYTMAIVTYALSVLLIGVGLFLAKCKGGAFVNLTGKISSTSLIVGVISLSLLLLSPLGELVLR